MLRASAVCEDAGLPSVSLVSDGFLGQAKVITKALRYSSLPVARLVGHPGAQSEDDLKRNIREVTAQQVITGLTQQGADVGEDDAEPNPEVPVLIGSLEEVNDHYLRREWSDGLPIIPPTRERIERFLAHTRRPADEVVATLTLPENRAVTVWSIAVNGVMAGCRPEYMPILIALIEAMGDRNYGLEHSGNTPGADTLIILNGPIIRELGFNYTQGVMRDGFQANTTVGRFWRLALRNLAGFLPHKMDKATYGNTWRVVVPENEEVLARIGWPSVAVDMGFAPTDSTVTISRMTGGDPAVGVTGGTPEELLPFIADSVQRSVNWQIGFTLDAGTLRPVVFLSPVLAETIAAAGWSKRRVKEYLFRHARQPAWQIERLRADWKRHPGWNLTDEVKKGVLPAIFAESDDPRRLVPVVWDPEQFIVAVTGDPLRTNAYVFAHNGVLGFPVTKKIDGK